MKNNLTNIKSDNINKIDWKLLQNEMKNKFGSEIFDICDICLIVLICLICFDMC